MTNKSDQYSTTCQACANRKRADKVGLQWVRERERILDTKPSVINIKPETYDTYELLLCTRRLHGILARMWTAVGHKIGC